LELQIGFQLFGSRLTLTIAIRVLWRSGVDLNAKIWVCQFCYQRNPFPAHYAGMTETNLPAELLPQVTSIEYTLAREASPIAPAFLFVVDTCLRQEELDAVKESILQTLDLIPPNSYVGLITFGTTVRGHLIFCYHYVFTLLLGYSTICTNKST
jgi:hypothetical protein